MSTSSVSVIIATRNRLPLLQEAIASVQGQTFQDWELIVVDDASEDATWAWLQTVAGSRIRSIRLEKHSERSTARNRGLVEARSEFVLFLDDDDRLQPRALERMVGALHGCQEAVMAIGARLHFDDRGHRRKPRHPTFRRVQYVWPWIVAGWVPCVGQWVARTNVVRASGGWPGYLLFGEHQVLVLRTAYAGPVILDPATVLEVREWGGQWRPADAEAIVDEIRKEFVSGLCGRDRDIGDRALEAWTCSWIGNLAYVTGEYRRAARMYRRALWAMPSILVSAPGAPPTVAMVVKAHAAMLADKRLVEGTRAWLRLVRGRMKRDPGATRAVKIVPGSGRAGYAERKTDLS